MKKSTWYVPSDDELKISLRDALAAKHGNIKHAADLIGMSRSTATRLMKRLGLTEYAAELRLNHGGSRVRFGTLRGKVLGRPIKTGSSKLKGSG